jgi:small multidrug resistance pump
MNWLWLMLAVMSNAGASVLIKIATLPPRSLPSLAQPQALLSNAPLLLGIALYGLTLVLYCVALTRLPLHVVHPVLTAGAIMLVALASFLLLKEPFSWNAGAGILCILVGVLLMTARHNA